MYPSEFGPTFEPTRLANSRSWICPHHVRSPSA